MSQQVDQDLPDDIQLDDSGIRRPSSLTHGVDLRLCLDRSPLADDPCKPSLKDAQTAIRKAIPDLNSQRQGLSDPV